MRADGWSYSIMQYFGSTMVLLSSFLLEITYLTIKMMDMADTNPPKTIMSINIFAWRVCDVHFLLCRSSVAKIVGKVCPAKCLIDCLMNFNNRAVVWRSRKSSWNNLQQQQQSPAIHRRFLLSAVGYYLVIFTFYFICGTFPGVYAYFLPGNRDFSGGNRFSSEEISISREEISISREEINPEISMSPA